jgi:putative nucleotidyltransferase with HDIG domain
MTPTDHPNPCQGEEENLDCWSRALEKHDPETELHSRRTVGLAMSLAREMGCNEEELEYVRRGALLHDIGKMVVPEEILMKPGPLTEREMTEMKKHPIYAKEMLTGIPYLEPSINIPYYHHERFDGKGYPTGLQGKDIPLPARIFTVIDQWDAMNSDRPYRRAWEKKDVIAYIKANSGKIYDPEVVDAFFRVMQ